MKFKNLILLTIGIFVITIGCGLYCKTSYKDFNEQKKPLNNFVVGLMGEEFLEGQIEVFGEELEKNNYIIAAKCEESFTYHFSSNTQKVTVEKVFKGEGLKEGETIDIARFNTKFFMDDESLIEGMPSNNLGYVNEMIPGKTYLIFLDKKLNTKKNIYIQTMEIIMAPIFCYEPIENKPCLSMVEYADFAKYETVSENEFFLMTEGAISKMKIFKEELLSKYPLNE